MKFLFVHQNFPGQFLHILRHLAASGQHDLIFITEENANHLAGVRKATYRGPGDLNAGTHRDAQEFEHAVTRAQSVAVVAANLRSLGFMPDIIVGHHGWGELLNLGDVWPGVPLLGYYEFYYNLSGFDVNFDPEFPTAHEALSRVRAKNAVNLLALDNPGHGITPTQFQRSTYPAWARDRIAILSEGVNLDVCRPDPAAAAQPFALGGFTVEPGERLVTYVARDLEPYRGFHIMMRALHPLLRARRDVKVMLVGADGVSYGSRLIDTTWREHLLRQIGPLDPGRVHFCGRLDYGDYIRLLQRSDAHVYLTYPFVASWSLREALATGCAIVGSDTPPVQEFVTDGTTGLLTPFLDPGALALRIEEMLDDGALNSRLRAGARAYAEQHLRMDDHLVGYGRIMDGLLRR
ncbi:MAG: glycosyltransferase [Gemmatimonadaceae bacterium]|nr:glycosyltransferase [Acetobacteraceae bacterium]